MREKSEKSEQVKIVKKGKKGKKRKRGKDLHHECCSWQSQLWNMQAREVSPCVRGTAGLEFGARSALKF